MSRTVIVDPNGRVTTIRHQSALGGCVSGTFWVVLGLFVVAAPAAYFPLWGAVLAYIVEGIVVLGALAAASARRSGSRG